MDVIFFRWQSNLCLFLHFSGPGASADEGAFPEQIEAANVAKECLLEATKGDSKVGTIWVNLSNAYYVLGDHKNARRCLEQVL